MPPWSRARDAALFIGGLLGVLHETLFFGGERPSLLILYGAMMGLPFVLKKNGA